MRSECCPHRLVGVRQRVFSAPHRSCPLPAAGYGLHANETLHPHLLNTTTATKSTAQANAERPPPSAVRIRVSSQRPASAGRDRRCESQVQGQAAPPNISSAERKVNMITQDLTPILSN